MFAFAHSSAGAEKKRDWQTGKVLDAQRSRYFAGTVGSADTNGTAHLGALWFLLVGRSLSSRESYTYHLRRWGVKPPGAAVSPQRSAIS